jgi:hypothetical protein
MTSTSERALELFTVTSQIANLHGYKNVGIWWFVVDRARPLFGADGSLGIPYTRVIAGYDATDEYRSYCESAIDELFTADEARAFVEFLRTRRNDASATIEPATLPIERNQMGHAAVPVGGGPDFLTIGDSPDYGLPFKVWGYFDVRHYEFDETLSGARRATRGILVSDDGEGGTDVQVWELEDPPKRQ